jgi:hypothetical protein
MIIVQHSFVIMPSELRPVPIGGAGMVLDAGGRERVPPFPSLVWVAGEK